MKPTANFDPEKTRETLKNKLKHKKIEHHVTKSKYRRENRKKSSLKHQLQAVEELIKVQEENKKLKLEIEDLKKACSCRHTNIEWQGEEWGDLFACPPNSSIDNMSTDEIIDTLDRLILNA